MKAFSVSMSAFKSNRLFATAALLVLACPVHAQSFCASDGQPRPVQLMERLINADCETCWTDPATPTAGAGVLALDWVAPGSKGDEAPLSTVASADASLRLHALGEAVPAGSSVRKRPVKWISASTLRVAHGLPVADYLGASIELKPIPVSAKKQQWTSWLALVETLPAGTEGSPIERNLVRNLLQSNWDGHRQLSKNEQNRFFESRSMSIARAANPNRLRVIGWVEDEKGQVVAAAQSRCVEQ
ncbi:MAG: hypothetical protein ABIR35_08660 [Polaromonas sp.]